LPTHLRHITSRAWRCRRRRRRHHFSSG
jgi:hypothetical protein